MLSIDKNAVDDAMRLSSLPQHRLFAAIGAYLERPELREHVVGLTLACNDDADLVAKYGCSEDALGHRIDLVERGREAFARFREEQLEVVHDLICQAFEEQKAGDLDKRTMAAVVSAATTSLIEADRVDLPPLVVSALLMREPVLAGVCAGYFDEDAQQIVPEQDWS